jgi:hypothetical protein
LRERSRREQKQSKQADSYHSRPNFVGL